MKNFFKFLSPANCSTVALCMTHISLLRLPRLRKPANEILDHDEFKDTVSNWLTPKWPEDAQFYQCMVRWTFHVKVDIRRTYRIARLKRDLRTNFHLLNEEQVPITGPFTFSKAVKLASQKAAIVSNQNSVVSISLYFRKSWVVAL